MQIKNCVYKSFFISFHQADIEKALDEVCSLLPSSISTECNEFVAKYSQLIIKLLLEELKPSQVCKELKLCSSNIMKGFAATVKLLSTKDTGMY